MGRSYFYSLEPIEIGNFYVESMTSYISRLARSHGISTHNLCMKIQRLMEVNPYSSLITNEKGFYNKAWVLNSSGEVVQQYAKHIGYLTGRDDLKYLTFNAWKEVLCQKKIIKKNKTFCSICYEEFKSRNIEVYDPLIWSIDGIKICPIHKIKLTNNCTNSKCGVQQKYLSRTDVIGYCQKCGQWLGIKQDEYGYNLDEEMKFQLWISKNLKDMIMEGYQDLGELDYGDVIDAFLKIKQDYKYLVEWGLKMRLDLDDSISIVSYCLEMIYGIRELMVVCYQLNYSLIDILKNGIAKKTLHNYFMIDY